MAFPINQGDSFSSSTRQWDYDVFLSFRGEDTRNGFTGHLYHDLCDKGIKTFIDNDLQRGEEISEELLKAISSSRISIIIFSQNYAFSAWCLDELVEILNCKQNGLVVLPIFYKVDPSEVRKQEGNFKVALIEQEIKFKNNIEKVQRWRVALNEAASLSGWHYEDREIVRQESKLKKQRSRLWQYEDALEVLTGSKGSDKIRGIMLHSPNPITVQLHAKAFKKMENLKFLMVRNVLISEELKYLPNELTILDWDPYPFSLPSNFCPQQLVVLETPSSCIRLKKLFKQGSFFKNLKSLNLEKNLTFRKLPDLCTPNLEKLDITGCKNLIEIDEAIGSLDKLKELSLGGCIKLKTLPSTLRLKSLEFIALNNCESLEKFPNIHSEMVPNFLGLGGTNIREWPSSPGNLIGGLEELFLDSCQNFDFLVSFSTYEFTNLTVLEVSDCDGNIIESHILTRPESFPSLTYLGIRDSSIVTIPGSISRFARLHELDVRNSKKLREISRLPPSMSLVLATNCTSLDLPSSCRLLNQFGEIFMDPNFCGGSDYLGGCELILPRIPKGFKLKHQSVGNSVSFRVGREFKKLVLCFAFQSVLKNGTEATCFVDSTNGFSEEKKIFLDEVEGGSEHLFLSPIDLLEWEESNPSEENLLTIKVKFKYGETIPSSSDDPIITWLGVHVDCICCGRGSSSVSDDIVSVSDDIDHHPFPSDAGLQLDTNLLKFHPGWGF
nr:disease resistance-like protein DSC2 isoform X3 [Quercus suber]